MLVSRKTNIVIISQVNVNTSMIAEVISFSEECKKQTKSNFGNERWAAETTSSIMLVILYNSVIACATKTIDARCSCLTDTTAGLSRQLAQRSIRKLKTYTSEAKTMMQDANGTTSARCKVLSMLLLCRAMTTSIRQSSNSNVRHLLSAKNADGLKQPHWIETGFAMQVDTLI